MVFNTKNEYTAGQLSEKRVKLIKPYFEIMATKKTEAWEKNYLQLKAIVDNNGKLFVGTNLYKWYVRQLTKSKLTKEQEEKLKSLKIELSQVITIDKHRADVWVEKLNLVKEYINLENKVIIRNAKYKGISIGEWLQSQKDNLYKNTLSVQQKESFKKFLDEYDEYISVGFPQGYDEWHYNYKILSEFASKKGRLPKKSENKKLYNWINLQKLYKKKGYLSDDKWMLLSNLGVSELQSDEELSERPKTLTNRIWEKNFNLCMEHYTEKGNFPVYDCIYKDVKIGFWLSKQRQRYRHGKLLPERIEKMKSVDMI